MAERAGWYVACLRGGGPVRRLYRADPDVGHFTKLFRAADEWVLVRAESAEGQREDHAAVVVNVRTGKRNVSNAMRADNQSPQPWSYIAELAVFPSGSFAVAIQGLSGRPNRILRVNRRVAGTGWKRGERLGTSAAEPFTMARIGPHRLRWYDKERERFARMR